MTGSTMNKPIDIMIKRIASAKTDVAVPKTPSVTADTPEVKQYKFSYKVLA
jgi:hypothetical protein